MTAGPARTVAALVPRRPGQRNRGSFRGRATATEASTGTIAPAATVGVILCQRVTPRRSL
ncbi:hypothetical protein RB199_33715 [Streptomyces libani]